jgi:hypothetical protein
MRFFRVFQHLLPDAEAWRLTIAKQLRNLFSGLSGAFDDAVTFIDQVYFDLFPSTTRLDTLAEWERQFGLTPDPDETVRRLRLAAEWAANGGQSPAYIQGVLQTAGFAVYVHEWWSAGPPYIARDPRDYTRHPLLGTWRCSSYPSQPRCSSYPSQPRCDTFLNNDPGYLVNKDLTRRAPPFVPDDPAAWPYFFYVGGATFGDFAGIDIARRDEFERLLLKLRPLHLWIVTLVTYGAASGFALLTEDGFTLTTEDGFTLTTG